MIYRVKANKHRFTPSFPLIVTTTTLRRAIKFDTSCAYDLKSDDQLDINKLFGVGYFPHHHYNSARFGWRWNIEKPAMEIFAHCYDNGERKSEYICDVPLRVYCDYVLNVNKNSYEFIVVTPKGTHYKNIETKPRYFRFGYFLRPYFGGNRKAPHEMKMKVHKRTKNL